jgi:hypothetical protein
MIATYQLNSNELDLNFLETIKKLFENREVKIEIKDISDTEYLSSIPNMVESIKTASKEPIEKYVSEKDLEW